MWVDITILTPDSTKRNVINLSHIKSIQIVDGEKAIQFFVIKEGSAFTIQFKTKELTEAAYETILNGLINGDSVIKLKTGS